MCGGIKMGWTDENKVEQERTLVTASHHNERWSRQEDEFLILHQDSVTFVANSLGRSWYAVQARRDLLRGNNMQAVATAVGARVRETPRKQVFSKPAFTSSNSGLRIEPQRLED